MSIPQDTNRSGSKIVSAFVNFQKTEFLNQVEKNLVRGDDPLQIIEALTNAMEIVGEKFSRGEYFLAELIRSAMLFKDAMEIIEPLLSQSDQRKSFGSIVLGTPKGDIHDVGKNLFSAVANASGLEIIDLGVDVPPVKFIDEMKETGSKLLGMSGLITPVFSSMKEVVGLLREEGIRNQVKVLIGGSVTTPECKNYIGADFQTTDAIEGISACKKFLKELEGQNVS